MNKFRIERLSFSSTKNANDALGKIVEEGYYPIYFFITANGDLGVVFEFEDQEPAKRGRGRPRKIESEITSAE